MKKIIDFISISFMVIVILSVIAITLFIGYVHQGDGYINYSDCESFLIFNQDIVLKLIPEKSEEVIKNFVNNIIGTELVSLACGIICSIYVFIFINLIYFIYKILVLVSKKISKAKYDNELLQFNDLGEIDLNTYDLMLAYIVYYKKLIMHPSKVNIFENYFKADNYLLENNTINEEKIKTLPFFEAELLRSYKKDDLELVYDEIESEIEKVNVLKKMGLVKTDPIAIFLYKFLKVLDEKYNQLPKKLLKIFGFIGKNLTKSRFSYRFSPAFKIVNLILIVMYIIFYMIFGFKIALIIMLSIFFLLAIFASKVFFTKRGKIERGRILKYLESLKTKEELTEREKLFLSLLE